MPEINLDKLVEAVKADLGQWYTDLEAQLRPTVDQAVVDLAHYSGRLVGDPDNAQHKMSIAHVLNTLKNVQALAAIEAHRKLQTSVSTVLTRVALTVLAAI